MSNFKSKITKGTILLVLAACHALAVGVIFYVLLPLAKWYVNYRPIWGVDFFLSVNIASLLNQHMTFPYASWNYAGFAGWPQFLYPMLSSYFISFLSNFYDLFFSAQIMVMVSSLLFVIGAYFLFYIVSKNIALSLILAVFVGLSGGVYQTLTWAGSLPSYASQMALPWALGFFAWFIKSDNTKLLLASSLISGISIWIHPLVYLVYILPSVAILNFLTFEKGIRIFAKIKVFFLFVLISLLIGLPQFYQAFGSALKSAVKTDYGKSALSTTDSSLSQTQIDIANFNKKQVKRVVSDNNQALFIVLPILATLFIASTVISRRASSFIKALPYLGLTGYFAFYIWLFGQGISIYHGGWYRLYWSVPIWVGILASGFWYESWRNLHKAVASSYLKHVFYLVSSALLLFLGYFLYIAFSDKLMTTSLVYRSQVSSAYPDVLNLKVSDSEREELKGRLIPSWINGDDTNWRLYDGDQTVNIWWNSVFKMPLARGYIDPPISNSKKGFSFLLDSGLSEEEGEPQLTKVFNFPSEVASSITLFLIDWNGIRYFEGPHVGNVSKALPRYLEEQLVKRSERKDFSNQRYSKRPVTLNFIEFKNDVTSPILSGTNVPTIGIFASENGYEIVTRALAERGNLNSTSLIFLNLGKNIDEYKASELTKFDALYLHDYGYKNQKKAFEALRKFLESGKKVYIDTGTEVPETNGDVPGDLFPVKTLTRLGQGKEWQLENTEKSYSDGVDFAKFSPPIFDDSDWSISYAEGEDAYSDSKVILKNKGKIIMASRKVGSGEVIWGGFNLAYHIIRNHNYDETKLFQNILSQMVDLNKKQLPQSTVSFINPNERIIKTAAHGVLFKEQAFDGWTASLLDETGDEEQKLKIYSAGPTYPGFMYVLLPTDQMSEVKFVFSGSTQNKVLIIVSMLTVIFLFEEVALGGILLGRLRRLLWHDTKKRISHWWQKEEE